MRISRQQSITLTLFFAGLSFFSIFACAADDASGSQTKAASQSQPQQQNAELRTELEQLKQLVLQQQARIAALERRQSGSEAPGGGELTDLASPPVDDATQSQSAGSTVPMQTAAAVVQAPQNAGSSDERVRNLERRIQGLGPLSLSGDIRVREEPIFGGPADGSLDRDRARFRGRLNIMADLGSQFQAGLSLASGDINDPTSTNQTLGGFYTRKAIALDQAYVSYFPSAFKPLTLTAGKFRYPWYNTELTWDKDLNPEGAAQTFAFPLENASVLKRVAVVAFELPFAEVAGTGATTKNIVQSITYGGQVQTQWRLGSHLQLSAYSGYYDFQNADAIAVALERASSKNPQTPWAGSLTLGTGNTPTNSIVTTASANIVTINSKAYPTGVTNITNAQFNSQFGLFDNIVRLDWDTGRAKLPVTVIGDYVQNTRTCANEPNILPAPTNTTSLTYKQMTNAPCVSNQRRGYWAETRVGRLLEKGDWQAGYTRIYIEREAVVSNFDYSEMRQGTNVTEHRVDAFYMFQKNVQLGFTALIGRALGVDALGHTEPWLTRLQFDTVYIF